MKDLLLPFFWSLDTRGVAEDGNGTGKLFDVSVIADGVRAVSVGEGGKTNSVCEGVARGFWFALY